MEEIPYDLRDPFSRPTYENPYMSHYESRHGLEITLRSVDIDEQTMRKLGNIHQAGRSVSIQDTEYMEYVEPFKNEFINFMMDKYPEKIISDPKGWDKLLGKK